MRQIELSLRLPFTDFTTDKLPPDVYGRPLESFLGSLGVDRVLGNSSNKHRQIVTEGMAQLAGVPYHHVDLADSSIDEISRQTYEEATRPIRSLQGTLTYQLDTAISKLYRMRGAPYSLSQVGIHSPDDAKRSLLMIADTINVMDGQPSEKPADDDEAMDQIWRMTEQENAYFVSNVQVATRVDWTAGIGWSFHLTPVRFNFKSPQEQDSLRLRWWEMYKSGMYPRTPGGVSQILPQIVPYLEVGLEQNPEHHIYSDEICAIGAGPRMRHSARWTRMVDLPSIVRNRVSTAMAGCSTDGYAAAALDLHENGISNGMYVARRMRIIGEISEVDQKVLASYPNAGGWWS